MSSRAERAPLRDAAESRLITATGAVRIGRLCPHCGGADHGRPVALGTAYSVSIAYAADLAVVAWAPTGLVGVDLEADGPPVPGVGSRAGWTRTEALVKASGDGLTGTPRPDAWVRRLRLPAGAVGHVALIGWRGRPVAGVALVRADRTPATPPAGRAASPPAARD